LFLCAAVAIFTYEFLGVLGRAALIADIILGNIFGSPFNHLGGMERIGDQIVLVLYQLSHSFLLVH
jgi:H+/gluconate symporter-like permease